LITACRYIFSLDRLLYKDTAPGKSIALENH
jgi:hypothetical protein